MKKFVALLGALAGVALLTAETPPAAPPAPPAPSAKPLVKEEPPIPGIVIHRPNGNQLGLVIANGTYKLSFYDQKRKPITVDVTRAVARWNPVYKAVPEQTVLNIMEGGKALGGGKPVLPPYAFKLHLVLVQGDGDSAVTVEDYVVDFTDLARPKTAG